MKKTFAIIFIFCSILGYGQYGSNFITWEDTLKNYLENYAYADTFYIDPDNYGDILEDGSFLHPYDSWEDFYGSGGLQSHTCYLQKKGTIDTVLITYIGSPTIPVTHVKVGAYGTGAIPAILTKKDPTAPYPRLGHKDGLFNIRSGSSYIMFDSIKLTGGPGDELGYDPVLVIGIKVGEHPEPVADWITNIVLNQVEIAYSGSAIQLPSIGDAFVDSILFDNCHIHDALAEGLYGGRSNATVRNCSINNISMGILYGGEPGGDACQLAPMERNGVCGKMKYIGNVIDRSATVNKFCIIHNSSEAINGAELYIIGNTFYPPRDTGGFFGSVLYLRFADMYIYGNKFIGRGYNGDPVGALAYIEATKNFYFVGNLVDSVSVFLISGDYNNKNQWIMNNTFANIQRKGPTLFNVWNDSTHYYGNIFALHGDLELMGGNADTLITSSNNISIIGDSLTWADHFTEWKNQDYSLKQTSSAIDGNTWKQAYYELWKTDLAGTGVPQIDGYVDYNSLMDIGAYQYDDDATSLFAPLPAFSANNTIPTIGELVTFMDESGNGPTSWNWIFEGGYPATSNEQNPIVIYNYPGTFNVHLTVSNSDGSREIFKADYIEAMDHIYPLMITEIMQNPSSVLDSDGEWFEVFNPTNSDIDMNGWIIKDTGPDFHIINSSVIVPAKGFAVLGNNDVIGENGGYSCDYVLSNFDLFNSSDKIVIENSQYDLIDVILYDGGPNWPDPNGASMVFTGSTSDDNLDFNFWEISTIREPTFQGAGGDMGSPGTNGAFQKLIQPVLEIQLNVFLEGPFNGIDMDNETGGILPLSQPYSMLPYNYHGGEEVSQIPNTDIVDWILVELRDASTATFASGDKIMRRKAAFIKIDGSIVDLDGYSPLDFNYSVTDSLFVVVWHRNHLGIMSAKPLIKNEGIYSYDFTEGFEKIYGGILGAKELSNDVWGMASGDTNSDGFVNFEDINNYWHMEVGVYGYFSSDLNMDTQTDNKDKDDVWLTNDGQSSQVPD